MGLHSTILCPEKIAEIAVQPGKRGTWVGKWFEEGARMAKTSSFFPIGWNEKKIAEKIIESLKKIEGLRFKANKIVISGSTSEGIVIDFTINKKGIIETFFPAISLKGNLCIP